jgi:hypothetical protein
MPRGITTLGQMVADLRLETGRSSNPNFGQDEYQTLARILKRTQNTLYWDAEWPFLRVRKDIPLEQGQRYYDAPEDLNFERIIRVRSDGYGSWEPVLRGIPTEVYDVHDSDEGEQSSPVQRWDMINVSGTAQIEVWPIPNADGEKLRLEGYRTLGPFEADTDVCSLDDTLVVLMAAVEVLAGKDEVAAKLKEAQATRLYQKLLGGASRPSESYFFIGGQQRFAFPRGFVVIAPSAGE